MRTPQDTVALVTGANSGIGKAVATGLARWGASVTLVVRNPAKGEQTMGDIRRTVPGARLELLVADLSDQRSIRAAAASFLRSHSELHVLVNVAGVFLPKRLVTPDGLEATFATNYVSYFLLTNLLLPALRQGKPARIVNVASRYGGTAIDFEDMQLEHRQYSYLKSTPPTMLARVLFTQELSERLAGTGVVVNAVHPGLVAHTELLNQTGGFFRVLTNMFGGTPEKGADTPLWLATAPENETVTGKMWASRKPMKTPGQGSDPQARKRLWTETEHLVAGTGQVGPDRSP